MATTISTRISFQGSEVTGQPLATNTRETPLSVKLSYTDGVEGVNMVWSMTDGNAPGTQKLISLVSSTDDRGTVVFTEIHGYTINLRSGTITFPKEADISGVAYFRYQPLTNSNATSLFTLTGPATISLSSADVLGDAVTGSDNRFFVFTPSAGADYDIIVYGVGTIV